MQTAFVFGHKKPDTDSVCASISLSYLKNALGMNTQPRVLGNINNETKFVLNYFGVNEPTYLNDVKVQIRNIRRDSITDYKAQKKNGEVTEDEMKTIEKDIQTLTDNFIKEIDNIADAKEKEILSV